MILSTCDVSCILYPALTERSTADLCRSKKLFAWRKNGHFEKWNIPSESLAMYLKYNSSLKNAFYNALQEGIYGGDDIMQKYNAIKDELENTPGVSNEEYRLVDLESIFGKEISSWLLKNHSINKLQFHFPSLAKFIPVLRVIRYLHEHPNAREKIQDMHLDMLANNDIKEPIVRHILMLYSYYVSNGYLV